MDADVFTSMLKDAPLVALLYFLLRGQVAKLRGDVEGLALQVMMLRRELRGEAVELPDAMMVPRVVPSSLGSGKLRRRARVVAEPGAPERREHAPTPIEPVG